MNRLARQAAWLVVAASVTAACGPSQSRASDYRALTETYSFTITSDPLPPHARERATFKVTVRDKESRQPISDGEGIIYAQSRDGVRTWDRLTPGPEVGTYYGNLRFITAGDWAIGIQFRRDSTVAIETVDYMQAIRNERAGGGDTP